MVTMENLAQVVQQLQQQVTQQQTENAELRNRVTTYEAQLAQVTANAATVAAAAANGSPQHGGGVDGRRFFELYKHFQKL